MTPQTSLLAYDLVKKTIPLRQQEVLAALRKLGGEATMHQVAIKMFRPLHSVSGRFSELEKKGYIRKCGVEPIPGRTPRTVYKLMEGSR